MKKANKFELILLFVSLAAAVFTIISVLIYTQSVDPGESDKKAPSVHSFETDWKNQYGLSIDITRVAQRVKELNTDIPQYLTKKVPENCEGSAFAFRTNNIIVNVYLDGEPVSFVNGNGNYLGMSSFQAYRLIPFEAADAGKEIKLEMYTTPFSFGACIDNVYFGSEADITAQRSMKMTFILVVSVLSFVAGLVFICIGIVTIKVMENFVGMIFFGLFSVFMSLWFINGSICAAMFSGNLPAIDAGFWLYLVISIIFGLVYVSNSFKIKYRFLYNALICLWIILLIAMVVFMLTGLAAPGNFVFLMHALIGVTSLIVMVEMISYLAHNKGNKEKGKITYLGVIIFLFFGLYDLCRFYQGNGGDHSASIRVGILALTITVTINEIREIVALLGLGIKAGKIGKIAYTDANTGIGNSAAFKEKMETLEFTKTNYNCIGIIQFDVNNLKIVNDTKGHEAGDYLIKSAANVINRSFGTIGTCYRTGGDEFVAITTYNNAPIACHEAIIKFNSLINQFNADKTRPFDLRIAYGVAYYKSADNPYISLKEIHKIADERMYNNKKELKAKYARTPEEAVIR